MCSDVEVEPPLLPLTGEKLLKGSITSPGTRLDASVRNLWSPLAKAFIDVRVFNPQAKSNWEKRIPQMYKSREEEKNQGYLPRVLQVEKGTFTPAVFSTSGGMGKEADRLLRRMPCFPSKQNMVMNGIHITLGWTQSYVGRHQYILYFPTLPFKILREQKENTHFQSSLTAKYDLAASTVQLHTAVTPLCYPPPPVNWNALFQLTRSYMMD